jgi:ABC-2 type transport system ATP-binding protein
VLSATHLTRRFGTRAAVDDLSFDLAAGEILALLGPNGAGKTTTLRMLAGLIAPSAGSVQVNGEAMTPETASRLRGQIGFLTEAPGLWENLTVRQNLDIYAQLYGVTDRHTAVDEALRLFEIPDRGDDRPVRLSKGLKQRVALARALVHRPTVVLLDEPTSGLDPESARDVRELVTHLRTEGRSILLCTHNLDEVERVADRVAVLRSRLVAIGTPLDLRQRLFAPRLRVRITEHAERYAATLRSMGLGDVRIDGRSLSVAMAGSAVTVPEIVRGLVEAGAGVESVTDEERSLEDVYIRLLHPSGMVS